jgi:hypothetical protein
MADHAVLLLSRRGDTEADRVRSWLSRIGLPAYRLDSDALDGVDARVDLDTGTVTLDGMSFAPTVTWIRHFAMRGCAGRGSSDQVMLYRDSWQAFVRQLAVVSRTVIGASDPGRLEQHAQARALGIRMPRTLITTDPASAHSVFAAARYVVKPLDRHYVEPEPGRLAWFHPIVVDARGLGDDTTFAGVPAVVQEYVPHNRELRVYLVGARLHAFEVRKSSPPDLWLSPDSVRVTPADVPDPVAVAVHSLAKAWNLVYGAFDFLIDDDGPVFLEVNPHGDWRWFEQRAAGADRISIATVRMVYDMHRVHAPAGATGLLTFLGAVPHAVIRRR